MLNTSPNSSHSIPFTLEMLVGPDGELFEKLRNIKPRLIENISNEIMHQDSNVQWNDIARLEHATKWYFGSDMKNLVNDASIGPLREALRNGIKTIKLKKEDIRPVTLQDFESVLQEVRPSMSLNELGAYEEWNKNIGSFAL
ncbi:hypothetical protein BC332_15777 [Capsicum chinense]|nr:hypothetical protein BC332_15777 [Capsicum chinense]